LTHHQRSIQPFLHHVENNVRPKRKKVLYVKMLSGNRTCCGCQILNSCKILGATTSRADNPMGCVDNTTENPFYRTKVTGRSKYFLHYLYHERTIDYFSS